MSNIKTAAALLELFARRRITNFDFENRWPACADKPFLDEVFEVVWSLYDDYPKKTINWSFGELRILMRIILFLNSNEIYLPISKELVDQTESGQRFKYWPFESKEAMTQARKMSRGRGNEKQ
jgi:hypothetical protein